MIWKIWNLIQHPLKLIIPNVLNLLIITVLVLEKILSNMNKKESLMIQMTGLHKYKSYDEYKKIQIKTNMDKIGRTWAKEENIRFISEYLKRNVPNIKTGLCHGTRRGDEQRWFRKYLKAEVIGTEISPSAKKYPNTIQWDFHDVKPEWLNSMDFIYSNSFDHTYKPEQCLNTWMSCLNRRGLLILEWSPIYALSYKTDPFGATLKGYNKLINKHHEVKTVLKSPTNRWHTLFKTYFIIAIPK